MYKNVQFSRKKNGDTAHSIVLPVKYLRDMGITYDDRSVELDYDEKNKTIFITKNGREV